MLLISRQLNQSIIIDEMLEIYLTGLTSESAELVVLGLPDEKYRQVCLQIGDVAEIVQHVSITLIEVRNEKARLGVEAPHETAIRRSEISDSLN